MPIKSVLNKLLLSHFIRDFISLVTNRGLDSLIGIIVIPYLIFKIGNVEYGKIVLAQAIAYIGVAFVNYGSDLLILKKTPLYLHAQKKRSISIFISRIIQLRFVIFLFICVSYCLLNQLFGISKEINLYVCILSMVCLAEVFSVSHLLVTLQDVRILPYISIFRFILLFLLTYIFVRDVNDGYKYIIYYSSSYLISNFIILLYAILKYKLHYYRDIKINAMINILAQSSPFFISKMNLLLSDKLYNILCASFICLSAVALLDVSFKILSVIIIPVQILSVVILGRFSMRTSHTFIRKVLISISLFSLVLFVILLILRSYILIYYSFTPSVEILFALSVILFSSIFANLSIFIGDNIMVTNSLEKQLVKSSLYSSLLIFPFLALVLIFVKSSLFVLSIFFLTHKIIEFLFRAYYSWNYIK